MNLSRGQEELKALLLEKKKDKKAVSYINPGRRLKGQAAGVKIRLPKDQEEETQRMIQKRRMLIFVTRRTTMKIMRMNSTLQEMASTSCWKNVC